MAFSNTQFNVTYIKVESPEPAGVPSYLQIPDSAGINGATTALKDVNRTGKFLGYQIDIQTFIKPESGIEFSDDEKSVISGSSALMIDAPYVGFSKLLNALKSINTDALIINLSNKNSDFRANFCDVSLIHIAPTYEMQADALGQWFRLKKIEDVFVLYGQTEHDQLYKQAFEATAKKFKLDIVASKEWQASFDLRRSAFKEIPPFTRTSKKYEAVFVADSTKQFAYSIPFNTHHQAPVTGDAGLQAIGWHPTHEQWGARQLQNRFKETFNRNMHELDYFAYLGVTAISTALQSDKNLTGKMLTDAILSQDFALAAYKGRKLNFREHTRQLRQPMLLAHAGALVTHAPLAGFLHQTNDLDTLGANQKGCK